MKTALAFSRTLFEPEGGVAGTRLQGLHETGHTGGDEAERSVAGAQKENSEILGETR